MKLRDFLRTESHPHITVAYIQFGQEDQLVGDINNYDVVEEAPEYVAKLYNLCYKLEMIIVIEVV